MAQAPLLEELMDALRCLPGVGPRSAQRMALHVLQRDRDGARRLASVLADAAERVRHCELCRNLCVEERCTICADSRRDSSVVCVVESPADVLAVEGTGLYRGLYHVLLGHLSPIDGVGPADIGLDRFEERIASGVVEEVILATNPTVEGEATAYYLLELLNPTPVRVSRIAHGVPLGGELEYVDGSTLAHAFSGRQAVR